MRKIETNPLDPDAFLHHDLPHRRNPYAGIVARWRPVMRRLSDATGDSVFLVVRQRSDSLCIHREVGRYPVQVIVVSKGYKQPLGVGAAGLALLAALPEDQAESVVERNRDALRLYGEMTAARMMELVAETRRRGWASLGNTAVPGALGVGMAWREADGRARLGVSVASAVDRMPWYRQVWIADLLCSALQGHNRGKLVVALAPRPDGGEGG